jgi:hypothetical protein
MRKLIKKNLDQIEELKSALPLHALRAPNISQWSVGNQLEHILISNQLILQQILHNSAREPESGKRLSWIGRLVLFIGVIPRGRGKAPDFSKPTECSLESLNDQLEKMESHLLTAEQNENVLSQSRYAFPHPIFGMMTVPQWFQLMTLHTRHHLKIIQDIIRSCEG